MSRRCASSDAIAGIEKVFIFLAVPLMLSALITAIFFHGHQLMEGIVRNKIGALILILGIPTAVVFGRIHKGWRHSLAETEWAPTRREWLGGMAVLMAWFMHLALTMVVIRGIDDFFQIQQQSFVAALALCLVGMASILMPPFLKWKGRPLYERIYFKAFNLTGQPYGWWRLWTIDLNAATATHVSGLRLSIKEGLAGTLDTIALNEAEWASSQRFQNESKQDELIGRLLAEGSAVYVVFRNSGGQPWWTVSRVDYS